MLMKRIIFLLTILCFSNLAYAESVTEKNAGKLIEDFSNTINNKNSYQISEFLKYNITDGAIFHKSSTIIGREQESRTKEVNYDKIEYINYILHTIKLPYNYTYKAKMVKFENNPGAHFSTATVEIEESMQTVDSQDLVEKLIITLINTTCNFTLEESDAAPKIAGATCIENINLVASEPQIEVQKNPSLIYEE
jgi:hypothetical protein